jgi:DNA uptake protein ComE-like DNA-binding protein
MSVRVVARIRPLLGKELDKDTIVRAESSEEGKPTNVVRIPNPKNEVEEFSFTFNGVYDKETSQEELFTAEVAPTLKSLFQGLDVTLFAYGVTGTGKTHTMRGGLKLSERGVIPRLLSGIYRRGRKVAKDSGGETNVTVTLSYYEIYNDKVFDLFEPPEKRSLTPAGLPLREKDGKTIVVGLSEHACDDLKEFEKLYIEANNNRSTAGTKLNAQSSRSHAILMVKVIQTTGDEIRTSTASAIDLAGSEDNRRTDNGKERLVESASINKSLFVLSQCIDAIGRGDKRIPYRESKMTRILSLGQNNGITVMILNLAPLRSYHLDTLSSLNVSSRAKRIEVREIENEVVFKQPPRTMSSISGSNIQRQPLRPLANAHNVNITVPPVAQKGEKPLKAFSVYSDKSRNTLTSRVANISVPVKRSDSTNKRPSENILGSRPTKISRPTTATSRPTAAEISAAKIEEMVERKVSEILAKKALNDPAPVTPVDGLSEAVQRRLEALEKKIEDGEQEDARAEGLRFLLMAKQHKERGEDSSALKMYELALPYFPGQEKLVKKIENLRAKIQAKKEQNSRPITLATAPIGRLPAQTTSSEAYFEVEESVSARSRKQRTALDSDDEYNAPNDHDASIDYEDEESFVYKPKAKKSRAKPKSSLKVFDDAVDAASGPQTPRTQRLLDVVNSRDVALIKSLVGVGAKKARDLVEFLEFQDEEDGGRIESLCQLRNVPGMGERSVERAYDGLLLSF